MREGARLPADNNSQKTPYVGSMSQENRMTPQASNNNPPDALERAIPVFPLTGAILMPNSQLPLNIFEPRYLAMVDAAMAKNGLVGMVQPRDQAQKPKCYDVGCVGKISEYAALDDGRYLIALAGLCRFKVIEELPVTTPFRQMVVDYDGFKETDMEDRPDGFLADRGELADALDQYLTNRQLACDWDAVKAADDETLVNGICMIAPFEPAEKQALLEAQTLESRAVLLKSLLDFDAMAQDPNGYHQPH
ncbi:MAG: LON peptidase substrate-binding domain-containing protein [Pseudomonadota bacterium]